MSEYHMKKLKTLGKRYARATTYSHTDALNILSKEIGFSHWKALTDAAKGEWQPNADVIAQAEAFVRRAGALVDDSPQSAEFPVPNEAAAEQCELGGQKFTLGDYLGDVVVSGDGWDLRVPEAPFKAPIVEIDERFAKTSPINDPTFLDGVLEIARKRSIKVRAQMAVDWPRRSTKADLDGVARHPLRGGEAAKWFCHSCDAQISGEQAAKNFWHCPTCGTHPLNIHETPFDDETPGPPALSPDQVQRKSPEIRIVEPRLTLHLNEETVSLLIRCALLEDAKTVNERLGAMRAEISLIDKEVIWITFDELLWPEDKVPIAALSAASKLGLEVEQDISVFSEPFAWPDMGSFATDTPQFVDMLLKAYSEHGVIKR